MLQIETIFIKYTIKYDTKINEIITETNLGENEML